MRAPFLIGFIILAVVPSVCGQCLSPGGGLIINSSVTLCNGTYTLLQPLVIAADDVTVTCDHTVLVGDQSDNGIMINGISGSVVTGCTLQDFNVGILATGDTNLILYGNRLRDNVAGIRLLGCDGCQILGNQLTGNPTVGIDLRDVSDSLAIDSTINGSDHGIYLNASSNSSFLNNSISANQLGFYLGEGNTGNRFSANVLSFAGFSANADEQNFYCLGGVGNTYRDGALGPTCPEQVTPAPPVLTIVNETVIPAGSNVSQPPLTDYLITTDYMITGPGSDEASAVLQDVLVKRGLSGRTLARELQAKLDAFRLTSQALTIKKTLTVDRNLNTTLIKTTLRTSQRIRELSIYEYIPKCIAQHVDEIEFLTAPHEIIESDPLVVWYFPEVEAGEKIELSYRIDHAVDFRPKTIAVVNNTRVAETSDSICTESPVGVPVGDCSRFDYRILIPIVIIPLLAFIYLFFRRFPRKR
jgi:parallel beta-helix repeat protein